MARLIVAFRCGFPVNSIFLNSHLRHPTLLSIREYVKMESIDNGECYQEMIDANCGGGN